MKLQPLKGTRDFYPEDMRKLKYIFKIWRLIAEKYGYEEFDGPLLESAELWTLKSGNEIPEQMYSFKDKSGRNIAIRPELTPTLARMIALKQKELILPIKWFSISRCWRYEAPQSGRLREFFQFNLDLLGIEDMKADAEVIATAINIMLKFNCTEKDFYVRISNRTLIDSLLKYLNIKETKEICRIIDKKDKITTEEFIYLLKQKNLTEAQITKLNNLLSLNQISKIPSFLDNKAKKALEELKQLFSLLKSYGYNKYIQLDLSIMRGLDYYTSTVFEIFDKKNKFRAIAGGGRYDNLVEDFEGQKCPGIGYGMGDVVLSLFLEKLNKFPKIQKQIDFYVAYTNPNLFEKAVFVSQILREKYNVELDLTSKKLSKQLKAAERKNAKYTLIIGEKELKQNKVILKEMQTHTQKIISLTELNTL